MDGKVLSDLAPLPSHLCLIYALVSTPLLQGCLSGFLTSRFCTPLLAILGPCSPHYSVDSVQAGWLSVCPLHHMLHRQRLRLP